MQEQNATPVDTQAPLPEGEAAPQTNAGETGEQTEQLRKAEDEARQLKDAYLRARAEAENVRRQAQNDIAKAHKYAVERFAEDLLPVKDALESALATPNANLETLRSGVELTLKQLESAFEKAQLTPIDPLGEKFDPHQHAAMTMLDSDQPANTVVRVMQRGYRIADRILRPALVAVSKPKD